MQTYIIDDVRFYVIFSGSFAVHRTDDVDLIIIERSIASIYIDYVIGVVYPESVLIK